MSMEHRWSSAPTTREEVFQKRMRVYESKTAPVIEHYRGAGRFREVDGLGSLKRWTSAIIDAIRVLRREHCRRRPQPRGGAVDDGDHDQNAAEIEKMRASGRILRQVHEAIAPVVVPGATTMDLENAAAAKIAEFGAKAAFKGYHGFPAALCTSVNEQVVHGMPNVRALLKDGDILSIDCGVILDGFYSDAAVTYAVGTPTPSVPGACSRPRLARRGDRAGCRGRPAGRYLCGGAGDLRGRGVWGGARVCRPRDRPGDARRSAGAELWAARQGAAAEGGDGAGDRADDQRGRARGKGAQGRLDGGDRGRQLLAPTSSTPSRSRKTARCPDALARIGQTLGYYKRCCVHPDAAGVVAHAKSPKEIVCRRKMQLK